MSQQKVDRHKEEKRKRPARMKRKKVGRAVGVLVTAFAVGAIIGIPTGRAVYQYQKKQAAKYATISSLEYDSWFNDYWQKTYAADFATATATDASATDAGTATDAATATDSEAQ